MRNNEFALFYMKHEAIFSLKVKEGTVKPVLSGHSKRTPKMVFNTDYRLIQVKSIKSAILSTFIKLPFSIKTLVLSFS